MIVRLQTALMAVLLFLLPSVGSAEDRVQTLQVRSVVSAGAGRYLPAASRLIEGKPPIGYTPRRDFDITHGFPDSCVNDMAEGNDGTLWLAAKSGLYSFDGSHVRHFDTGSVRDGVAVKTVVRDDGEEVWFGTTTGVAVLRLAQREVIYPEQFRGAPIQIIGLDHLSRVLVVTDSAFFVQQESGFSEVRSAGAEAKVLTVSGDLGQKVTWVGTDAGLCTLSGEELKPYPLAEVDGLPVQKTHVDRLGALWLATDRSVLRLRQDTIVTVRSHDKPWTEYIRDFTETKAGLRAWLFKESVIVDATQLGADVPEISLQSGSGRYRCCLADRNESLWFGMPRSGIACATPKMRAYNSERIKKILKQPNSDVLWFTALLDSNRWPSLIRMANDEGIKIWSAPKVGVAERAQQVGITKLIWHDNRIVLGTWNGVYLVAGDEIVPHPDQRLLGQIVDDFKVGPDGTLWIALRRGVFSLKDGQISRFSPPDEPKGTRRISPSTDGLTVASHSVVRHYDKQNALVEEFELPVEEVQDLLHTRDGSLLIGTSNGLFRQTKIGKPASLVYGEDRVVCKALRETDEGHLLVRTGSAPYCIDLKTGLAQPIVPGDFPGSTRVNAFCPDGDGTWLGSEQGLYFLRRNENPPELIVYRVATAQEFHGPEEVVATVDSEILTVSFNAATPSLRPGSTIYRYRMRGLNEEWLETRENEIEYRNLPVGDYTLELQAFNRDLSASEVVAVPIRITMPALRYATYGLLGALSLAIAFTVGFSLFNQRQQNRVMADRVEEAVSSKLRLEEELRHSQKLESLGTLASGMAHDFNNALQVVVLCSDQAQGSDDREVIKENLATIQEVTKQARGVTRSMLTLAGKGPRQTETADLAQLTSNCLRLIRPTIPRSIVVDDEAVGDERILADADVEQIKQALVNVLLNARDAMPNGGLLKVSVESLVENDQSYAQIKVRDSGVGIAAEKLDRIFEPFYTTKPREKGTGLGLAMAQGIFTGHNGSISVQSVEGTGTTFRLRLPRSEVIPDEVGQSRLEGEQSKVLTEGAGFTVLVAEDNGPLLKSLASNLEESDFRVLTTDNGAGALEVAYKCRPDVLVLDVDMPIMNGLTALQRLRDCGYLAPAVVISGAPIQDTLPPNTRVLEKPFTPQQLHDAIHEQLCSA